MGLRHLLVLVLLVATLPGFGGCSRLPTEEGAAAPRWKLQDFQPKSARYGQVYGLEDFRGSVLLLALYAGTCNTCVGFARLLDGLEQRWRTEGLNVRVAALNAHYAAAEQKALTTAAPFPLFQDTPTVNAFGQQGGRQDDVYVYTPQGRLSTYFRWGGSVPFDPFSNVGESNLSAAIVKAGGQQ